MNSFPQPAGNYQDEAAYAAEGSNYTPHRHSKPSPTNRSTQNKHTNTPSEFMLCSRCREKITKKNQEKYANCPLGDCDRSLTEYTKALNYINSCHGVINQMMKQSSKDCGEFMRMPDLPNFVDLFQVLTITQDTPRTGEEFGQGKKTTHTSRYNQQLFNDKSRNNSADRNKKPTSPKLYQSNRSSNEDQSLKSTTKGKFIELLPDMKQTKFTKQDNFSPGTTESEESDLELSLNMHKSPRIAMQNKFKNKMKSTREKVIYEEDSGEDESENVFKKDSNNKSNQKSKEDNQNKTKIASIDRNRFAQSSSSTPRNKTLTKSLPPMGINAPITNENIRKVKQRSSSTVTPRERSKIAGIKKGCAPELAGNYSDTIITAGSCVGQVKKSSVKSLCTPIDIRNNELSQQDLDKYAKELLGSESASPRTPRSKSPVSTGFRSGISPEKAAKVDQQDKGKKFQKPTPSPTIKSQAADQKRRNIQEKSIATSNGSNSNVNTTKGTTSASSTNIHQKQEQMNITQQQQQMKKFKKTLSTQRLSLTNQTEQNQIKKCNYSRRSSVISNSYTVAGSFLVPPQTSKTNSYSYGSVNQQQCSVPDNFVRLRNDQAKVINANGSQDEGKEKLTIEPNDDIEDDNCSSPEHLNLLCDNTETLSMHSRCSKQSCSKVLTASKAQYAVISKPNDFFTTNRKSNNIRIMCSKHDEESADSDDIKTDSEIEDDHFEKNDGAQLSRKSSKTSGPDVQMSQVLTHLGLLSNAQVSTETEQLIKEAKSIRAHDERNRPFREPRKINENTTEHIMKIDDNPRNRDRTLYQRQDSLTHLHRTISEESSDIKSDEEIYNVEATNSKPYNFCLGNSRYQK